MSGAITVSNEVTIDHWELGRDFANWDNRQQAWFLHGVYVGLQGLGSLHGGVQLLSIRDAASDADTTTEQQELIRLLHEYLVEPEGVA